VDTDATPLSRWLARLETISSREIDLGLERVTKVLGRLALPPARTVLHVAGTNGKGSSVAMLESLLRTTDSRIGSYTSPHILRFNERICVDGRDAEDSEIIAAFERVEAVREGEELTYFEFGTLAALVVFAEAGADTLLLEIGLGGRLDAVNAVEPTAGLITNIGLDHCAWLGEDVESIAFEKAGIMRPGRPVVFGAHDRPVAIDAHARDVGARLLAAGRDYDWQLSGDTWSWRGADMILENLQRPVLVGDHQVANAAGVLALLEASGFGDSLTSKAVSAALADVQLDGRIQSVVLDTHWVVDVAHNPDAAEALALGLAEFAGRTIAIVGMLDDKDVEQVVGHIDDRVDEWIAVTADSPRAIDAAELGRRISSVASGRCHVADSLHAAMQHAEDLAGDSDRVLVTGSFYLVGPVLDQLYSRRKS
jgi:dihydrofolate synthase/folylpolyglutamate synthase